MKNIRVLLINDDMPFCHVITNALQAKGYEVNCQHSTVGLSEIIRLFTPDIVLLDVTIGKEDGIAAIPQIILTAPEIPIIFVSEHKEVHEIRRALKQGAINYLIRPLDMEILIAHIERHARPCVHTTISIGTLTLDLRTRDIYAGDTIIKRLSKLEFQMLQLLYERRNQFVSSLDLRTTETNVPINDHTLYNYIGKLRDILSADQSITLATHGKGYVLQISN